MNNQLISLHYEVGNCRHKAAMFSALLEAAGIDHNIQQMSDHPLIDIKLPSEHLQIDFAKAMHIEVEKGKNKQKWMVKGKDIDHAPTCSLRELENHPDFQEGMNKILLQKAIENASKTE